MIKYINMPNLSISQLYIKFDKKIILSAKNIDVKTKKNVGSKRNYKAILKKIKKRFYIFDMLFSNINIQKLTLNNMEFSIFYDKKYLFFYGNDIFVTVNIDKNKDGYFLDLKEFYSKKFDINLSGKLLFNEKNGSLIFDTKLKTYNIVANLFLNLTNSNLTYKITNAHSDTIEDFVYNLASAVDLNEEIKYWLYGYTSASDYKLDMNGTINLDKDNAYDIVKNMHAIASAKDAVIEFDPKLPPVVCNLLEVEFINNNLNFYPKGCNFQNQSLNYSKVIVENIVSRPNFDPRVKVFITTDVVLDNNIASIIKHYVTDLHLIQKSGVSSLDLLLDFDVLNISKSLYHGTVHSKNSSFSYLNTDFDVNNAKVEFDNNGTIFDINATSNFANFNVSSHISHKKKTGVFDIDAKDVTIKSNNDIVYQTKNLKTKLYLNFADKTTKLNLIEPKINFELNNGLVINSNIENIIKFSPFLNNIGLKSGNVNIQTKDYQNFDITCKDTSFDISMLKKDATNYDKDDFFITITPQKTQISSASSLLNLKIEKNINQILINDLDYVFKKSSQNFSIKNRTNIYAKNSSIILNDINKTLKFTSFSINSEQDKITFKGKLSNADINITKQNNGFKLSVAKLSGSDINKILNKNIFYGSGTYSAKISGKNLDNFSGKITMDNSFLKDYTLYQNLFSFINTIPALLIFKSPEFNDKGFKIKHGKIIFELNNNILQIKAINLNGDNTDIIGFGNVDLKSKNINLDLEIVYLKDASSILDKIPIVNQIILGRDRKISTVLEVYGTIDNPKYKTKIVKDLSKTPFTIIKNILELPVSFFD